MSLPPVMYDSGISLSFLFQTISVSVSVLTLSCIAQDRWYAICHPLMFKSTAKRARKSIVIIWVVSCVMMIPQAVVMESSSLLPELTNKTSLFTVCDEHWGGLFPLICLKCTKILIPCFAVWFFCVCVASDFHLAGVKPQSCRN